MYDELGAYLEEIGHYLAVAEGREEILSEIRSHILEKAERESGGVSDASLGKVIAAYGPARRVAEKYLDGQEIIAPAYKRYLFRYTGLLFAAHVLLTVIGVALSQDFVFFPFLFIPKLGPFDAVLYLPTALLADLGLVTLILILITRSRKDVKLPWPKISVDIDEVKPRKGTIPAVLGFLVLLALTGVALFLYLKYGTIFLKKFDPADFRPLLSLGAGQFYSPALIILLGLGCIGQLVKIFRWPEWVNLARNAASLVILGVILARPIGGALVSGPDAARFERWLRINITVVFGIIAVLVAVEVVKSLVIIGRRRLSKER
jgi:hypothetical protein